MERFDADVGSSDAALQKAPIVFESVGVDVPTNVGFSMVNHVVDVFGVQTLVSNPSITEHLRTRLNVFAYFGLQSFSLNVRNYRGSDFPVTRQEAHDGYFAHSASAADFLLAFADVHIPRQSADVSFIGFNFPAKFSERFTLQRDRK